ncbi:MAG: Smr/MutS family protein, partial [Mogibacterium sp.]|nr:Smr/MutS family protein [Mogibacterium sp.]
AEAEALRRDMQEQLEKARRELADARMERDKLIRKAKQEAREILEEAQETVDEVKEELKNLRTDDRGHQINAMANSRRKLREAAKKHETPEPIQTEDHREVDPSKLVPGVHVRLLTIGQNGTVVTSPDAKGNLSIQIGALKTTANVRDIMLVESEPEGNKARKRQSFSKIRSGKAQTISMSLNVIGRNLDDALMDVTKYLDDAFLAGMPSVTIVHGRGEGILREGIRKELKKNKHVKSFKTAPYNQGGDGATIVELKDR